MTLPSQEFGAAGDTAATEGNDDRWSAKTGLQRFLQGDSAETLQQAVAFASHYLDTVDARSAFPDNLALDRLQALDEPLPERPTPALQTLRLLDEFATPATVSAMGGRYFGFVHGGVLPVSLAAMWLASAWDQNAALNLLSPGVSKLEEVAERWLVDLLGLPAGTSAGFVSGTTLSLLCGFAIARNTLLKGLGRDVHADGLAGAPSIRVVVGEQAHACVFKMLSLLGFGQRCIETVKADAEGRMILEEIPPLDAGTLLVAQAGNVNSGAFDPLADICELANRAGAWVHVDGAFGLWARASKSRRSLVDGMERADSWSIDAHKTLNTPYDCGVILCRHREAHLAAMQAEASYIIQSEDRDGMMYTPEMGRRARAVEVWAALKNMGRQGTGDLVDQLCDRAAMFARLLGEAGFEIVNDVVFNQVLVRCGSDADTRRILQRIQSDGTCWCGGATWNGRPVIRISVCSWRTTANDVERSVAAFVEARNVVSSRGAP